MAAAGDKRIRLGMGSTASLAGMLVTAVYSLTFLGKVAVGLAGIVTLGLSDTYIGGVVLNDAMAGKYSNLGWATSIATSAILLAMMGYAMARKGIAYLWFIPAVIISVPDIVLDMRFPTLVLYGHDAAMSTGLIPPQASFVWWVLEVLFTAITLLGELGIALIFSWLFMVIMEASKKAKAARTAKADSDGDASWLDPVSA